MNNLKTKIERIITFKGSMDTLAFRNYIIGLVCYRYLSEIIENFKEQNNDKETSIKEFGYFIKPNCKL